MYSAPVSAQASFTWPDMLVAYGWVASTTTGYSFIRALISSGERGREDTSTLACSFTEVLPYSVATHACTLTPERARRSTISPPSVVPAKTRTFWVISYTS